jgi:hypothetical protein
MNRKPNLGPLLTTLHEQMRGELDAAFDTACNPTAGVWDRWAAVRLVETELRPCLLAERDVVQAVGEGVPAGVAEHLWAVAELLNVLGARLCELGRMAQGGCEFLRTAEKYRLAFSYWCGNVETFVGPVSRSAVPNLLIARLQHLEARAGCSIGV